ncbi:hypothetical protein HD600_002230 [Microbacterium ginsengiterrae]|uniref:DUF2304 domain-containing protein n=1 Tax=Microbacterium ginsengiterrae TaxID=546115 RepID=A0A7W9CDZ1_9MICO|nr:DUF2304 domain-containing protein [Microbacterium ginsengiterrae]MBB5743733.1 hypothetical protein [Microbacterium ginsengiterrae]
MNGVTYAFGIVAALLVLVAIIELMRKGTLRERHAVWWFFGGLLALVVAVFPQVLTASAALLGVAVPVNLSFFVAIGLLFLVSLQSGAELTRIESRMRDLSEQVAFSEQRVRVLESEIARQRGSDPDGQSNMGPERHE